MQFINWSFFDTCFTYEKFFEGEGSDYELEIEYSEVNNNVRKYKYKLKTEDAGYYGLNIVFDPKFTDYTFDENTYSFFVHYEGGDIVYNFTDIVNTLDGDINYYISNDIFYLELGKYLDEDIEFELDPTFGNTFPSIGTFDNYESSVKCGKFQMGATGGTADSITVYTLVSTAAHKYKCALYGADDVLVGQTDEIDIGITGAAWKTFTFAVPPIINADAWYYIACWAESTSGVARAYWNLSGGSGVWEQDIAYDTNFPNPYVRDLIDADALMPIYCSYTESAPGNTAPTINDPIPANQSTSISRYPQINFTVYDADGDGMYINISENTTGSWRHQQYNASSDGNIIWENYSNASSYSTRYDWRVNITDGQGGSAEYEYWFVTEAEANTAPTITGEIPANQSTSISLTPQLNFTVYDANGDTMFINITENSTGGWLHQQFNTSTDGNIIWESYDNASTYSTRYDWRVNITDGQGGYLNASYWFVTEIDPNVNNAPTITGVVLANKTTGASLTPILNVTVHDDDNDNMYINWSENTTGSWRHQQSNLSIANGTSIEWNNYSNASSYSTRYDWRVNITDGQGGYLNASYWFETKADPGINNAPTISNPIPANKSTGISRYPQLSFDIVDIDGDTMFINISENTTTGNWLHQQFNTSTDDTIILENYSNASAYSTIYWWRVNITDGQGGYINASYYFTTEIESVMNFTTPFPSNSSIDICLPANLGITVSNPNGNIMNITFWSNLSGTWSFFDTGITNYTIRNATDGTYYIPYTSIYTILYNYTYYWNVSVTDGTATVDSDIYHFTTVKTPCRDLVGGGSGGSGGSAMGVIGLLGGTLGGLMAGLFVTKKRERRRH